MESEPQHNLSDDLLCTFSAMNNEIAAILILRNFTVE